MPVEISVHEVMSLNGFIQIVEERLAADSAALWFRGCGNAAYSLLPTLYRHPSVERVEELIDLEGKLLNRFKQRSIPYHSRSFTSKSDCLFFMQHYGVPTRLLDWTENPYVGMYFALTSALRQGDRVLSDCAVWMLDPILLNKFSLRHMQYPGHILSNDDKEVQGYFEDDVDLMNEMPVAIYGSHNSHRIVAQRGVFTIFGKSRKGLQDYSLGENMPVGMLTKMLIKAEHVEAMLASLISIGYTDSVVFPDLDGLSKEIKRFYKFEVR